MAPKTAPLKLKVYQAAFGFHDSVVAAANQSDALRAWGTHQNLFAEGQAKPSNDPQAIEAALAHPETPLLRAIGSTEPFSLEPTLPKVPAHPPMKKGKVRASPKQRVRPPPPDRSKLTSAESTLAKLDQDRAAKEADFKLRREALDTEESDAHHRWQHERLGAKRAVDRERESFLRVGGDE